MSMPPDVAHRRPEIGAFLDALFPCLAESTAARAADRAFVAGLAARVAEPGIPAGWGSGDRPEVLGHLEAALAGLAEARPMIRRLGVAFAAIAPSVPGAKRRHEGPDAERFAAGPGNALIIGPGGAEECEGIVLGVSLLAPHTRYPDHSHPPDELYFVLSDGEWRQGEGDWMRPGIGGTVRNPPGVVHAMRAGETPLLAVWGLLTARAVGRKEGASQSRVGES
jgi:quercetin dioxygenase-like cupin family protein